MGAVVYLTAGGVRQREDVLSGGSYESSNDQRPHFGIGDATAVDALEIRWPSGAVEHVALPSVDRFFTIQEGRVSFPASWTGLQKQNHLGNLADKCRDN